MRGVVVRTYCGLVLCMGKNCGHMYIDNFSEIEHRLSTVSRLASERDLMRRQPGEWLALLSEMRGEADALSKMRVHVKTNYPGVKGDMDTRLQLHGGQRTEMLHQYIETNADGEQRVVQRTFHIAGIEFWDGSIGAPNMDGLVRDIAAFRVSYENLGPSLGEVESLVERRKDLAVRVERLLDWVKAGRVFFSGDNVAVVMAAYKDDDVKRVMAMYASLVPSTSKA
jgi:hypothetical protein